MGWSSNSRFIAAGTSEGYIEAAEIKSKKRVLTCKPYEFPIRAIAWNRDGSRLASAADDGFIKLLDSTSGNELLSLRMGDHAVALLSWSPDGHKLAAASDKTIRIWDATRGYAFAEGGRRQAELAWLYYQFAGQRGSQMLANRKTVDLAPKSLDYRWLRGIAFVRMKQFDEAAREFAAARPKELQEGLQFANLEIYAYLGARNLDAYRELLAKLNRTVGERKIESHHTEMYWRACLIPDAGVDFEPCVNDLKQLIEEKPEYALYATLLIGAARYRQAQYAKCAEELTPLVTKLEAMSPPDQYRLALTNLFLAMSGQQLGHQSQGVRFLREATAARDRLKEQNDARWTWLVEIDAIYHEAKLMIEP